MNILGVLVHARAERCGEVRAALETMPGVEVHAADEAGRMVVTVEHEDGDGRENTLIGIHNVEGVLGASLVYQQQLDEKAAPEVS